MDLNQERLEFEKGIAHTYRIHHGVYAWDSERQCYQRAGMPNAHKPLVQLLFEVWLAAKAEIRKELETAKSAHADTHLVLKDVRNDLDKEFANTVRLEKELETAKGDLQICQLDEVGSLSRALEDARNEIEKLQGVLAEYLG